MRRKLLVVAYYFPPFGLSGVQRTTKFVKYLPSYGWDPTVLTVDPGSYFAFDATLLDDVDADEIDIVRTWSSDPTRLFGRRRQVRLPSGGKLSGWNRLSSWLFVPDNKVGWRPHAIRTGHRLLGKGTFDAVFSTAPPYSSLLIAADLARFAGVPLVADFRDDWLENPRHVYPTPWHRALHADREARVLNASSAVVTINDVIANSLSSRMPRGRSDSVHVIPQGYDPEDFPPNPSTDADRASSNLSLLYAGVFYDAQRPDGFLKGLARALDIRPELRGRIKAAFAGLVPESFSRMVAALGLDDVVRSHGYVPHAEVVRRLQDADVLWMIVGRRQGSASISTGKLFEYFGSRKPILGLVPEGAARDALSGYGAGFIVDPDDIDGIAENILLLDDLKKNDGMPVPTREAVMRYDRKTLTGMLASVLNDSLNPDGPIGGETAQEEVIG